MPIGVLGLHFLPIKGAEIHSFEGAEIHSFWLLHCRADGKVALGKVAPGRLTPVLFALRKSDPLERLPQGIFALPEY